MVNITFLEVHLDDASLSTDRVFSPGPASTDDETTGDDEGETDAEGYDDDTDAGEDAGDGASTDAPTMALAVAGVLLVAVGIAALVRYLRGGDEPDVEIETAEDDENRPVGVTVDE